MNNVHININDCRNASRIFKQVNSLTNNDVFSKVLIIAMGNKELPLLEDISTNVVLNRINLRTKSLPTNLVFQFFKYIEFSFKVLLQLNKHRPEVVNAHSLSILPIALLAKFFFRSKVIYDAHELETERNGLKGIRKKVAKFVEKSLIKHVDITFVVSENIADWYDKEYQIVRPIVVLNTPRYRDLTTTNHFREKFNISNEQVILLYQGALTKGRGIDILLEVFKSRTNNDLVIVFMGYGGLEDEIKKAATKCNNIYFFPAVHPDVVLEYTSSADLGVSFIENVCLSYYYCMPNKLFEYAMAGLPVLVSNMKDMSELVIENNMGEVAYDSSVQGINDSLERILQGDLPLMKKNAYQTARDNSWEIQEVKMLSGYSKIINRIEDL